MNNYFDIPLKVVICTAIHIVPSTISYNRLVIIKTLKIYKLDKINKI